MLLVISYKIQTTQQLIIYLPGLQNSKNMNHTLNHAQLIQHVTHCSWKDKLSFFGQIAEEISQGRLQLSPRVLEQSWVQLLRENNINILLKVVACLNNYAKAYFIPSFRIQRQIIRTLLGLTKMKRHEIDDNIAEIIWSFVIKEKEVADQKQLTHSSQFCSQFFNSFNNPTFYIGVNDEVFEEEDTQINIQNSSLSSPNSIILEFLIENLKGCRKQVISVILIVIFKLTQADVLNENEKASLSQQIKKVKDVILNRKHSLSTENSQLETTITYILHKITYSL